MKDSRPSTHFSYSGNISIVAFISGANRPCRGETVSGDTILVVEGTPATTLVVADGLGHGDNAAVASRTFCDFIGENHHMPLPSLMKAASKHSS